MPAVGRALATPVTATPWRARWIAASGTDADRTNLTTSTADVAPVIIPAPSAAPPDALVIQVGVDNTVSAPVWNLYLYDRTLDVVVAVSSASSADFPNARVNDPDNVATAGNDHDLRVHTAVLFDVRGMLPLSSIAPEWFLSVAPIGAAVEAYLFNFRWLHNRPL